MESPEGFQPDDIIRVDGWRGRFRVIGYGRDGSVLCWGGPVGAYQMRSAMPGRCHRVRKGAPERIPAMAAPTRKQGAR